MNKDDLILSRINDCSRRCANGGYVVATGFLDSHEQAIAGSAACSFAGVRRFFYGGYEGAERRLFVCVPTDWFISDEDACDDLVRVLRVTLAKGAKKPGHRDYLGSILGLGLERSVIGDILVRDDGADILVTSGIADFLLREYVQAGRTAVSTEVVDVSELNIPEVRTRTIRDTVSSARLDNIVSSAFSISRSNAAEAVRSGLVSVDHVEVLKPDAKISEGAVLVLKGKGKAILSEIGGDSREGRTWIRIERFTE